MPKMNENVYKQAVLCDVSNALVWRRHRKAPVFRKSVASVFRRLHNVADVFNWFLV